MSIFIALTPADEKKHEKKNKEWKHKEIHVKSIDNRCDELKKQIFYQLWFQSFPKGSDVGLDYVQ